MYSFEIVTSLNYDEFDKVWNGSYQHLAGGNIDFDILPDSPDSEELRKKWFNDSLNSSLADDKISVYKITKDGTLIAIAWGRTPDYSGGVFLSGCHLLCDDRDGSRSYIHDPAFIEQYKVFINEALDSTVIQFSMLNSENNSAKSYISALADSYGKKVTDLTDVVTRETESKQYEIVIYKYVLWVELED